MCVILTTVAGRATDTFLLQQEMVIRGAPQISENWDPLFSGSVRIAQLEKTAAHFEKTAAHSANLWLNPYGVSSQLNPQPAHSVNCLKQNQKILGLHSNGSSINMIKIKLMLLIMYFFLKSITRAWSTLDVSTVEFSKVMIV